METVELIDNKKNLAAKWKKRAQCSKKKCLPLSTETVHTFRHMLIYNLDSRV